MERTFTILKPDCVKDGHVGKVIDKILSSGYKIIGMKMMKMTRPVAEGFYEIHKGKSFFEELILFMTEGPCIVAALEKENAIEDYRTLMGATNPLKAAPGTIRKEFAENISRNVVHGADSPENAIREIAYFFSTSELIGNTI
ncbi:MAG: nucleoside-diphosphate kinase [Actinobacteria bacterium]|nr:nucleoside-diphosphate kinase [Actinomycetota bacterium]